jgi:hypothetical protein
MAQQADRIALGVLREAEERLTELAALEANWDSYGGDPPTAQAIAATGYLLTRVAEQFGETAGAHLRPFAIAPTPDGGVHVEWRRSGYEVAVDVGPDGSLGYLLVEGDGEARQFSEAENASPESVLDLAGQTVRIA